MPPPNSKEFYAARAERSRELAASSIDPNIAMIQHDMAENYAELARFAPTSELPFADPSD